MEKQQIRERVWDELEESGVARFPFPSHGRIPNFAGADEAAERLAEEDVWRNAEVIKANPDSPQRPVRRSALEAGKTVYMAVPRLQDEQCFLRLDPATIDDYDHATTIGGSADVGQQVGPDEMERIDLIVSGSVAVDETGARVGKGEGYSDLEFAVLRELGLVHEHVPVATTIHELQVLDDPVEPSRFDVLMDLVVTPERTVRIDSSHERPAGVYWEELSDERIEEIPVLQRLSRRE